MSEISIQDNSGDRDHFTIIPNYIANHSTAIDQALYFQMKKHAGETGKCFATTETMMKKLSIGYKAYKKSLNYLLKNGWIEYVGLKGGRTRPIKTYKVNNIWKLNSDYYENKILPKSKVSFTVKDTSQKQNKILPKSKVEEDPLLIRTINKSGLSLNRPEEIQAEDRERLRNPFIRHRQRYSKRI